MTHIIKKTSLWDFVFYFGGTTEQGKVSEALSLWGLFPAQTVMSAICNLQFAQEAENKVARINRGS